MKLFSLVLIFLVFVGGFASFGVENATALDADCWAVKASVPENEEVVNYAVAVDGKIYAIGKTFTYEYDPTTDNWVEKTPMPTPRADFGFAVYQNKIYTIGGFLGGFPEIGAVYSDAIEVYDPVTDIWEIKAPMPTSRGSFFKGANAVGDKIHLIVDSIHDIYDPETESWTTGKPMPLLNSHTIVSSTVLDEKIYLLGGNVTQIYDPKSDTWSLGAASPIQVSVPGICTTTGAMAPKQIYVFGGAIGFYLFEDATQIYDPTTDTWTLGEPMITARSSPACVALDDVIYVIGGTAYRGRPENPNEQYTPVDYIPEFPSWIFLPLLLSATLVVLVLKKRLRRNVCILGY